MKLYTKGGDKGKTSLIGGTRVGKDSLQIETYGTVDELNSYIGVIRDHDTNKDHHEFLIYIQDRLFTIGALLAQDQSNSDIKLPELNESDIDELEAKIDELQASIPPMTHFILPGGHPAVSFCHVARCVCRRTERLVVALNNEIPKFDLEMKFLNRLSDYLFILSRSLSKSLDAEEVKWIPKK